MLSIHSCSPGEGISLLRGWGYEGVHAEDKDVKEAMKSMFNSSRNSFGSSSQLTRR